MRRRDFITLLGGAAAWPLAARAQQPATPVIGFLKQPIAHVRGRCAARISPERNSSIQSKFSIANRWAMKSLIACQNEASRGLSSASRLTALTSSSSAARCAARFVPTGVRKSRILSSAVGSLFASNSDDRARDRKASMHVSRRVLMTMLNAHTPLGIGLCHRPRDGSVVSSLYCMNDSQPEGHMASHIGRRKFLATLGGAAVAWPLVARAQQTDRMRRIGVLMAMKADDPESQARLAAFAQGLQQSGWTIGQNVRVDYRWSGGNVGNMRKYAMELVALAPDVILAHSSAAVAPLLEATRTVPIVFTTVADPVGAGYVDSLARPGGNATGFVVFEYSIAAKWLELLKEIAPGVTRAAVLRDSAIAVGTGQFGIIQAAAPSLGVELRVVDVRDAGEIERAITVFAASC